MYTLWFDMYPGDARWRWDGAGLTDPRVTHFWDDQKVVGSWFSASVTHRSNPTWDYYGLYGPDATWPSEPVNSGGTLIGRRDQLLTALGSLQHS